MTPKDKYFRIAAIIWEAYFETRAGKRFGEEAVSRTRREELLDELRKKIKFKEQSFNDKELINKIHERKMESLKQDINNAFKKLPK